MLNFLRKNKECEIYSPVIKGNLIKLEAVPDKVFASGMMGQGVGFINQDTKIAAPFDGEIIMTVPSRHAVGIKSTSGIEVMIHIGLDTVQLNGDGFHSEVEVGDKVKRGDILISYDADIMKKHQVDMTTPMIITDIKDFDLQILKNEGDVQLGDKVMICKKK